MTWDAIECSSRGSPSQIHLISPSDFQARGHILPAGERLLFLTGFCVTPIPEWCVQTIERAHDDDQ